MTNNQQPGRYALFILFGLLFLPLASAAPSTDPADYFFYDDMTGSASMTNSYTSITANAEYNTTNPYPGGTKSIRIPYAGVDTALDNIISSTNFTSAEYSSPYCLNYAAYESTNSANNQEAGVIFGMWAHALLHNRDSSTSSSNMTYIDNAVYNKLSSGIGTATWANITVCMTDGYAGSGTTTGIFLKNGVNVANVSSVARNQIDQIGFHQRLPSSGVYYVGLVRIWNYTAHGTEPPEATPPASDPYASVSVKDLYDNASLSGLTVYIGTDSNVTDGSGVATVYNPTGLNYTVDGGANYFNVSGTATENATVTAYVYGAFVTLEAFNILETQLNTFNVTSGGWSNTTTDGDTVLYLKPATANTVTFTAPSYISKNATITTTGKDTGTYNTTDLYQTVINITGTDLTDSSSISNFTLNYTGVVNGTGTTTSGNVTILGLLGNYSLTFDADGYAIGYYNLSATTAAESYDFEVYTTNSINFSFYDEETGALINSETVYLELISTAQSGNYSTTTGSIYEDLLSPDAYTARYNSVGYEDSFYYFNLVDRTFTALNLTLLNTSSATSVTLTVYDTLGDKLEAATVKVLKYDIVSNSYNIVEILNTNFEGVAVANIVLNSEYYKFIIDYEGETRLTTTPTYIYGTTLTFYIPTGNSGMIDYFNEADLSGTLNFNYATNLATFTYSDLDNTATQGCLYAYTSSSGVNTLVNTSCSSSSSGSLNLVIFNSSSTWYLEGVVTKSGEAHTISTYRVDFTTKLNETGSGAFFAFILLATIVFIGLFSLEIAVVVASAVPLLFTVTRLADFDYVISIPILLLGLVTAFIIGSNKK